MFEDNYHPDVCYFLVAYRPPPKPPQYLVLSPSESTMLPFFTLLVSAQAKAYFYIQPGTDRCFLESIPSGQVMTVSYSYEDDAG